MRHDYRAALAPWWPCFVCGDTSLCPHREQEIVQWMHAAPSLAQIAASRPEPVLTVRTVPAAGQLELFAQPERRRA
jgi:hypothetical protein